MEDDKLKDLFGSFDPQLSSGTLFISRLKRNMESVEMVRKHTEAMKKRNRIAVGVAATAGFVMGVILTSLLPLISNAVTTLTLSIPIQGMLNLHIDWQYFGWAVMAVACVTTAINAYEITLSRLTAKKAFA